MGVRTNKTLRALAFAAVNGSGGTGKVYDQRPYSFRAVPHDLEALGKKCTVEQIVGGTLAWNQKYKPDYRSWSSTENGITFVDNRDGSYTVSTDANGATSTTTFVMTTTNVIIIAGHVYAKATTGSGDKGLLINDSYYGWSVSVPSNRLFLAINNSQTSSALHVAAGTVITNPVTFWIQVIDLTQLFGATIANAIYNLETATRGAGVAWLTSLFPKLNGGHYIYSARKLLSVNTSDHKTYAADESTIGNYPLDSSLTLRGVPKLDADGNLYYDGDTYAPDGTVTRKYGKRAYQSGDESLADAITDGTNTVYKLATPTTESADPYTAEQSIDPDGTEEYVDVGVEAGTRDVAVPVGHYTGYATKSGNAGEYRKLLMLLLRRRATR